ncbi:MAG: cobyrinate a,c-diamide synthase [Methanomassiliicoccales archaeon]
MIAGERSGVGKSTITLGLLMALKARGFRVQSFKAGPDFLDPMHHSAVLDRQCRNLDTYLFGEGVREMFLSGCRGADIAVVEGVMGLYDGLGGSGEEGSTSHLSKVLDAPVILVIDASAIARSAGAAALGFSMYDREVDLRGVVFNGVGGRGHLRSLEDSLRGLECLGGMPRSKDIELRSRHLGLVPAQEDLREEVYEGIVRSVEEHLDVDRIVELACEADDLGPAPESLPRQGTRARIGVAYDQAFNFYYPGSLDILRSQGAELVFFSPLRDGLPDIDGLYFGGGFPELHIEELEANREMRRAVLRAASDEMPVYAECGGMMYLCSSILGTDGREGRMVGVFDCKAEMTAGLQALGYVRAEVIKGCPLSPPGASIKGHVFHYSRISGANEDFCYRLTPGKGIAGEMDGMVAHNTLSSYTHLHFASRPQFAHHFVRECELYGGS